MEMPIKVIYYHRDRSTEYESFPFKTYDEFGRWYLDVRKEIVILDVKEIIEEPTPTIACGDLEVTNWW